MPRFVLMLSIVHCWMSWCCGQAVMAVAGHLSLLLMLGKCCCGCGSDTGAEPCCWSCCFAERAVPGVAAAGNWVLLLKCCVGYCECCAHMQHHWLAAVCGRLPPSLRSPVLLLESCSCWPCPFKGSTDLPGRHAAGVRPPLPTGAQQGGWAARAATAAAASWREAGGLGKPPQLLLVPPLVPPLPLAPAPLALATPCKTRRRGPQLG